MIGIETAFGYENRLNWNDLQIITWNGHILIELKSFLFLLNWCKLEVLGKKQQQQLINKLVVRQLFESHSAFGRLRN